MKDEMLAIAQRRQRTRDLPMIRPPHGVQFLLIEIAEILEMPGGHEILQFLAATTIHQSRFITFNEPLQSLRLSQHSRLIGMQIRGIELAIHLIDNRHYILRSRIVLAILEIQHAIAHVLHGPVRTR